MPKYSQYNVPTVDDCVNFGVGQPDTKLLPLDFFKESLTHYSKNLNQKDILQYSQISGYDTFKKSLAEWLNNKKYSNHQVNKNELFIVNGITGGLQNIVNQYFSQNDVILVEEPSYFHAINIFKEYGLNIDTIPMKKDGIDLEILEQKVRKYSNIQKNIFLYTIPTCHNPTGYTLSDIKRKQLASIATVYNNFYIIADEVYHFLRWDENERILPMSDYHLNFISLGSFSKLLAPSLRVGWIYINSTHDNVNDETSVIEDLSNNAIFNSSGGINVLGSMIVQHAIETGFLDKYINDTISILQKRCMVIVNKLKDQDMFEFETPLGGYFLWLKTKYNTDKVQTNANSYKVSYHSGSKFSSHKQMNEYLRLSFSYYNTIDLETGIDRLISCFKDYQKTKLAIMGSKGNFGSAIIELLNKKPYSDKFMIVSLIDRTSFTDESFITQLDRTDAIVDVSSADGTMNLIKFLNKNNINKPILSGTTGHSLENFILMKKYGEKCPIMNINNFSKGIPILKNIISIINSLPNDWSVQIKEVHNINKTDSPLVIANSLKSLIKKECIIESILEEKNYGNHKIICSNKYETIEFSHQALNKSLFAKGCLDIVDKLLKSNGFNTDLEINFPTKLVNVGTTYSAHGNILKVIEDFDGNKKKIVKEQAQLDKNLDGVVFINDLDQDYCTCEWEYYNRDGNEVDFCGNGIRCIMRYIYDTYQLENLSLAYKNDSIASDDSLYDIKYNNGNIMIQSPDRFDVDEFTHITQTLLEAECEKLDIEVIDMELHHVGIPNLIVELKENVLQQTDILEILGNILNQYYIENFNDNGININFVNLNNDTDEHSINIVTWERDVNRITKSCGSGSLASYYYYLNDNTIQEHKSNVKINLFNNTSLTIIEESYITYLSGQVNEYITKEENNISTSHEINFI
tara:strand:+ start:630 stop:3380 length:2751 start_codon:yes stop_codon:yes gene_type:complete